MFKNWNTVLYQFQLFKFSSTYVIHDSVMVGSSSQQHLAHLYTYLASYLCMHAIYSVNKTISTLQLFRRPPEIL